jgi:uncharacterized protein
MVRIDDVPCDVSEIPLNQEHNPAIVKRGTRMLKEILKEFLVIEGVTAVALIGRDGFVIEIAQTIPTDIDALGAYCSDSLRFFEKGESSREMGLPRQIVVEYRNGPLIITPITKEEFLVVLADTTAGLGRLNYSLPRISSRVAAII